MKLRLIRTAAVCVVLAGLAEWTAAAAGKTQARLVLSAESARPGDTVWAGVRFGIPDHWHIYWRNPGTTGIATDIKWSDLPAGITAGPVHWPVPGRRVTTVGDSEDVGYEYEQEVVLLAPLTLGAQTAAGTHNLSAKVTWLECETGGACVPGSAEVTATLKTDGTTVASADAALIDAWRKKLPQTEPAQQARAFWDGPPSLEERPLVIEWTVAQSAPAPDFFPFESEAASVHPLSQLLPGGDGVVRLRKKATKLGDAWPKEVAGLLVPESKTMPIPAAFETKISIEESVAPTAVAEGAPVSKPAGSASPGAAALTQKSFLQMLLYAFLGGLILNVMPCVLPVIALKILSFVNQSKEDPRRVFQMGLVYAAGVVFSFLALAGLVIAVKQAGKAAGWGMQFANPKFLVCMTVLVTLVALNLFGLFEVQLSGGAMNAAGGLAAKEGPLGAFFQGMLATALATPCTAPFLAPALGFAFAQSTGVILVMFATIAVGLAFPYVLLSWQPAWLRFLPKPGVWMARFKVAMGFPMLATAVWLFWLTEKHYGRDGVLWFGIFLVVLSLAAWVWGEFVQRGSTHRGLAMAAAAVLLAAGYVYAMEGQLKWREARQPEASLAVAGNNHARKGGVDWQPWSAEAVARARAERRVVLVDFTADWCLTCNVNKKTSIEIPSVESRLKELNAVALIGDHTLQPPAIQAELAKFGRAGVPLVLVYPRDPAKEPIVLPEVLTPGIVLDALQKAVN